MLCVARYSALLVLFVLCGLVAGCSAHASASGGGVTSTPASPAASGPALPSAAASVPATASRIPALLVPVLGQSRASTQGYGSVRPSSLSNGGDPTGIVTNLSWQSWGGSQAVGTGMGYYDPPNVPVDQATKEEATVVAFNLGTCSGVYMYQAIEWYFPESGGSFNPASYLDVCSWTDHGG